MGQCAAVRQQPQHREEEDSLWDLKEALLQGQCAIVGQQSMGGEPVQQQQQQQQDEQEASSSLWDMKQEVGGQLGHAVEGLRQEQPQEAQREQEEQEEECMWDLGLALSPGNTEEERASFRVELALPPSHHQAPANQHHYGVDVDPHNSVFGLASSWFLPAMPVNTASGVGVPSWWRPGPRCQHTGACVYLSATMTGTVYMHA